MRSWAPGGDAVLHDERKRALLEEAERLVRTLRGSDVKRSEVSPVVNLALASQGTWPQRLAKAKALAERLPDSWLRLRSKSMPEKLSAVKAALLEALGRHDSEEEVRFLLGWTLRLLRIAESSD